MSTIVIQKETKNLLKQIGKKTQTYDDIINELIKLKRNPELHLLNDNGIKSHREQENIVVHRKDSQ